VLRGVQINRRYSFTPTSSAIGSHHIISHDGPRSPKGGRVSYVSGSAIVSAADDEHYMAGCSYEMPELQYHETPNSGIVVTLMQKLTEGKVHACSLVEIGHVFDQDFDRFQLSPERLWDIALDALRGAA
jgi:hypothetical protein